MARTTPAHPATVLVVENEAIVRVELVAQLDDAGYRVFAASDADEAIGLLDQHPEIAILLTDRNMPGSMDGIRLAHHVRDRWPPVKMIVASGMIKGTIAALPKGSVFLAKPYDPASLMMALAQHGSAERACSDHALVRNTF